MSRKNTIDDLRQKIDQLDEQILQLINQRIGYAKEVGAIKRQLDSGIIYRPEREAIILDKLINQNIGPLEPAQVEMIFRQIISVSRSAEAILKVATLGPTGTYSEAAVQKHFGQEVKCVFGKDIEDVFRLVESELSDYAVVPVENSTEGSIRNTLDCLIATSLCIVGEVNLRIRHSLVGTSEDYNIATTVFGHEQAIAQCRRWLDSHLPSLTRVGVSSNAEAARRAQDDPFCLAIAGEAAAKIYGLKVLANGIEDESGNTTRFFVIGNASAMRSGRDKTSLILSSHNQAGSLQILLEPLTENNISMSRIESRPSRTGLWEYIFFIDIDGHVTDNNVKGALNKIEKAAALFKVLGSYPRAF